MIRIIGTVLLILAIFIVMIWFTQINPGQVRIDLAAGVVEPSIPMALSVTFAAGWLFGVLCTLLFTFRLLNERRRLRGRLRASETELSSLRSLPIADAD